MASRRPKLRSGRVYRTKDLERWSSNAPRLARRLVNDGVVRQLRHGMYYKPRNSRFGEVPPSGRELVRAYLGSDDFVLTGSEKWNELGLGSTAVAAKLMVYNRKRTGEVTLDARKFSFQRVRFPKDPSPEWYVVNLFENSSLAGVDRRLLTQNLYHALEQGRFDSCLLGEMAKRYGSQATQSAVEQAA